MATHLSLAVGNDLSDRQYAHVVSGQVVTVDRLLPGLSPFASERLARGGAVACLPTVAPGERLVDVFSGVAWVGASHRNVHCAVDDSGSWITVDGAGAWWVSRSGEDCGRVPDRCAPRIPQLVLQETALGPVLLLALARAGVLALHASAVMRDGRAVAFVGESGCGKSTLARVLGEIGGGWTRIGDDILPFAAATAATAAGTVDADGAAGAVGERGAVAGVDALPHYPQLKLPPDEQPGLNAPERLPLAAVYVLETPEPGVAAITSVHGLSIDALPPRDAALALAAHTVPAKLFDRELLAKHTAFVAGAVEHVAVRRLSYPRTFEALAHVDRALTRDFEQLVN